MGWVFHHRAERVGGGVRGEEEASGFGRGEEGGCARLRRSGWGGRGEEGQGRCARRKRKGWGGVRGVARVFQVAARGPKYY